MANRFYTIMVVPEKTAQVRKIVLPSWVLKGAAVGFAVLSLIGIIMVLDYWYVMGQISENKELRLENRRLRQQVQVFQNKMATIESTMDRVKTFATRLRVITNVEDRGGLLQSLNQQNPSGSNKLPEASANVGQTAVQTTVQTSGQTQAQSQGQSSAQAPGPAQTQAPQQTSSFEQAENPEEALLQKEYLRLDETFSRMNEQGLYVEQMLQDQYELLADQKAFLAALPTIKPAIGYFTSGFGIRKAPIGGRVKMHEGLDIANRPGTPIRAPADGVVIYADSKSGYGQTVILDHGYGLETWYGHTRKITVSKGQKIHRGEVIALLGNSGRSTGPHVHYEVRVNGTPVDPLSYILEN